MIDQARTQSKTVLGKEGKGPKHPGRCDKFHEGFGRALLVFSSSAQPQNAEHSQGGQDEGGRFRNASDAAAEARIDREAGEASSNERSRSARGSSSWVA